MTALLLNHLWQSTLCIGVALILARMCRNAGAHVRYGIWLAASLKFLVPFSLLTMLGSHLGWAAPERVVPYFETVQAIAAPLAASEEPSQIVMHASKPAMGFTAALLAVWALGAALLAIRWVLRWNAARAVVRAATPVHIDSPIEVRVTPVRVEPGVFGIFRPALLLPESLFESLQPEALRALLAHETAHVQRRDNLTAALHCLTEVLFWFHPLVWWIGARLVAERERACDEAVIRAGKDRNAYAQTILSVCRASLGAPIVSASGASGGSLRTRIEAIMNDPVSEPLGVGRRSLLAAAIGVTLAGPIAFGIADPAHAQASADSADAPALRFTTVQIMRGDDDAKKSSLYQNGSTRLDAQNITVRELVRFAYAPALPTQVNGGPGWLDTERYTITAIVDHPDTAADQPPRQTAVQERVRSLLADRFQLRARVTKGPVYILESAEDGDGRGQKPVEKGIGTIEVKNSSMSFRRASSASVALALSNFLLSPVLDHTKPGVTYDISVELRSDLQALGDDLHQQAGLTLKSFTLEQLTIDGAERPKLDDAANSKERIAAR